MQVMLAHEQYSTSRGVVHSEGSIPSACYSPSAVATRFRCLGKPPGALIRRRRRAFLRHGVHLRTENWNYSIVREKHSEGSWRVAPSHGN